MMDTVMAKLCGAVLLLIWLYCAARMIVAGAKKSWENKKINKGEK